MAEITKCSVHGTALEPLPVKFHFGLLLNVVDKNVRDKLFPNSQIFVNSGCLFGYTPEPVTEVLACQKCREAESAWRKLDEAYADTSYIVDDGGTKLTISYLEDNPELQELLKDRGAFAWAFLTAYNPHSRQFSEAENLSRQTELIKQIEADGYQFLHGYGKGADDTWEIEPSLLIFDITLEAATAIGKRFEQNAILWGDETGFPEMIWCI